MIDSKKIAVTHDWLLEYAGAERVLEQLLHVLGKDTTVYTTVFDGKDLSFLDHYTVNESFISKLPFGHSQYRKYLPLMPLAVEQWDMNPYDIVVSSSYAVAKGIISHPDQLHISYVHSPMRYGWDLQYQYLKEANLDKGIRSWISKYLLHRIRLWDVRTANQVDYFIANSKFIQRRIQKAYRRDSVVIYPPVDVASIQVRSEKEDFYVTASRMVPYKRTKLIIEAFNKMPQKKLIVLGNGPAYKGLKKIAGSNVELKGFVPREDLIQYLSAAKAFVYAAVEDFGIAPVEAQACGTPVIALSKGGTKETIVDIDNKNPTGLLFHRQEVPEILRAIQTFEENQNLFESEAIRQNAERFSVSIFREQILQFVEEKWENFKAKL